MKLREKTPLLDNQELELRYKDRWDYFWYRFRFKKMLHYPKIGTIIEPYYIKPIFKSDQLIIDI